MTQNTQTTAERIRDIIEDHIDAIKAAQKIAAEIDALTQTNALMLESAERGQATIAELRALIPVSRVDLGAHDKTISALAAELNALKAERDEARNIIAANSKLLHDAGADFDRMMRERDEAREMIARLKPSWMGDNPRPETLVETCQRLAGEVNALTRERDEARRSLLVEREAYSKRAAEQTVSGASKLMIAELAEVRAEIERLTPLAKNWLDHLAWAGETIRGGGIPTTDNAAHARKAAKEVSNA